MSRLSGVPVSRSWKMLVKRFEDLEAWKEARKLSRSVYKLTKKELFRRDLRLKGQIQDAAVSCMSNIAEGFDSDTKQQFVQMLFYARRSASEVQSELYVALDQEYVTYKEFDGTYEQAKKVRKLVDGLIRYLKTGKPANRKTG